jgi:hypothetical protein
MTARIAIYLCAALLLATVPAARSEAQPGPLPAARHAEFLKDPGYRAAYAIYDSVLTAARILPESPVDLSLVFGLLLASDADIAEWTDGIKDASLHLGTGLRAKLPASASAEHQGFYRLWHGDHFGGEKAGDLYEGTMTVMAVGAGPRGTEYGVAISTSQIGGDGDVCGFAGLEGYPDGGRMIFRFLGMLDDEEHEVEVVFRGDAATVGPQKAISAQGNCGMQGHAEGEYRRAK